MGPLQWVFPPRDLLEAPPSPFLFPAWYDFHVVSWLFVYSISVGRGPRIEVKFLGAAFAFFKGKNIDDYRRRGNPG